MPGRELLRDAEAGALDDPGQVAKAARRMLEDPRARLAMEDFVAQWLRFDRVLETIRYRRLFPEFNSELAAAMTEETKRLFSHLVWENKNFMELFSAGYGFLSSDLAELYGFAAPDEEFAMVRFPAESGRAGVLGQATYLTLTSKPSDTSPTVRRSTRSSRISASLDSASRSLSCLWSHPKRSFRAATVRKRRSQGRVRPHIIDARLIPAECSVVFGHSECLAGVGAARCAPTV